MLTATVMFCRFSPGTPVSPHNQKTCSIGELVYDPCEIGIGFFLMIQKWTKHYDTTFVFQDMETLYLALW